MRKLVLALGMVCLALSTQVMADAASELKGRLEKVSTLHANFTQDVYTADNKLVQNGSGELWLKRPNLFRWHMVDPDESLLVSDGKTLWFYNPFVEQVTITHLNAATDNTPLMLITRNSDTEWKKYAISQNGNHFVLVPKAKKTDLRPFEITVNQNGAIASFIAKESDGQRSMYKLTNHNNSAIAADKFTFIIPQGTTLDDQR